MPVTVASGEIHVAINPLGVLAKLQLDDAHRLDELAPIHRAEERRLPMLLLIDTWSAACCWFPTAPAARS
jgi:hypothetical protein